MRRKEKELLLDGLARSRHQDEPTTAPDPLADKHRLADDTQGLELYCAQLVALLERAPRFAAAGAGRSVVELEAPLAQRICEELRYLLILRRPPG